MAGETTIFGVVPDTLMVLRAIVMVPWMREAMLLKIGKLGRENGPEDARPIIIWRWDII